MLQNYKIKKKKTILKIPATKTRVQIIWFSHRVKRSAFAFSENNLKKKKNQKLH